MIARSRITEEMLRDDEIYYSDASNWQYFSVSQYKEFAACEARALAKLRGEWSPKSDPTPLLVGNYVHSYFESPAAHERFIRDNAEAMTKSPTIAELKAKLDEYDLEYKKSASKSELIEAFQGKQLPIGDLLNDYKKADDYIAKVEGDPLFQFLWQGEKEVPITGSLYGQDWKGKIDLLNVEKGYFVDLKTTARMDQRYWSEMYGMYVSFVDAYRYGLQLAVYEQLLEKKYGKPFTGYIYAVSKEAIPDIAAIEVDDFTKQFEADTLKTNIERVAKVKNGEEKPESCGKCDFCKTYKRLSGFIKQTELID